MITILISKNIVITTTSPFTTNYLIKKQGIQDHLFQFKSIQKITLQYKVVIHNIPTAEFNTPQGMELVVDEIKVFNKGLTPIGTPYQLTPAYKRESSRTASVVVAFATQEEAQRAIRERLYIVGISARAEKYLDTPPSSQCTKCQGFGHPETHCKRDYKCGLCGDAHLTKLHKCTICKKQGTSCIHLVPRCSNCQGSHTAFDRQCEVRLAIVRPNTTINL